ncbi:MAG: DUF2442 domain-containing protein [Clostridia bacterium]|nr:DUF2442 domain-containing protein [Clostridia bacterium]
MNKRIRNKKEKAALIWPEIQPVSVQPLNGYCLLLTFSDAPKKQMVYDVTEEIGSTEIFAPLQDKELFSKAYIDYGTVLWNDEMELHPDSLYKLSIPYEKWLKQIKVEG